MSLSKDEIRNLFSRHIVTDLTISQHERLNEAYIAFAEFLNQVLGDCDAETVKRSIINLKKSAMWANFAVAEKSPLENSVKSAPVPTPPK